MDRSAGSIDDLKQAARRRLPRAIFDTIEGGAGQEQAMARNAQSLRDFTIIPRILGGIAAGSFSARILGKPSELPLILAPTGLNGIYRPEGERLVAAAASSIVYAVSCISSIALEEVAVAGSGRKWFQLYPLRDREVMLDLMARARAANYEALCLTVDVPALGSRHRDQRSGIRSLHPSPRLVLDAARHPTWSLPFLFGYRPRIANFEPYGSRSEKGWLSLTAPELDPAFGWEIVEWVRSQWPGPLVVKGVLYPDDARRAFQSGAQAIVVSNHGGRQLDAAPSPLSVLPQIRESVGASAEVYADGAVMGGEDILKYLVAGANACMVGRAYLYGLAAAGASGVEASIAILKRELDLAIKLAGIEKLASAPARC